MKIRAWDGFEVDGSSTSYEVRATDREQVRQALVRLLGHPLWDRAQGVGCSPPDSGQRHSEVRSFETAIAAVLAGQLDLASLRMVARPPRALEPELLAALCRHSARRVPPEPNYLLAGQPHLLPEGGWFAGGVEVEVRLEAVPDVAPAESELGLAAALLSQQNPCPLELSLGPTFIYEYAVELTDTLRGAGELEVAGGLDCAGGWTWGCTYAATLYPLARLPIPGGAAGWHELLPLLPRPLLPEGIERYPWWSKNPLREARDLQFAASGQALLDQLGWPETVGLDPVIEHIVERDAQVTLAEYREFCDRVAAYGLPRRRQRDLTLVYLLLPKPEELPGELGEELVREQLAVVQQVSRDGPEEYFTRKQLFSEIRRLAWTALDEEGEGSVLWCQPTLAAYAAGVLRALG